MVDAEGYKEVDPNMRYEWNREAIYIPMKKDDILGIIKGIVKSTDGATLISGVRVMINNEYTALTDSLGRFNIQINSTDIDNRYNLTLLKDGYKAVSEYYYPASSNEFRMEKI